MIVDGRINDRWDLMLPDFRAQFHAERPKWEAGRLEHMASRVEPGMTVYDVGAEHGDFTALYRKWVGVDGTVVPIEPSTAYWPCIQATWDANVFLTPPQASFVGFASDRGEARFGLNVGLWPSECAGDMRADPGFRHLTSSSESIPQIRLDTLAYRTGLAPDAVVIDVEGAEWEVLRGLARLVIEGVRPLVWVSVHDIAKDFSSFADWYGKTLFDLHDLMDRYGYTLSVALPSHGEGESFWYYEP